MQTQRTTVKDYRPKETMTKDPKPHLILHQSGRALGTNEKGSKRQEEKVLAKKRAEKHPGNW